MLILTEFFHSLYSTLWIVLRVAVTQNNDPGGLNITTTNNNDHTLSITLIYLTILMLILTKFVHSLYSTLWIQIFFWGG